MDRENEEKLNKSESSLKKEEETERKSKKKNSEFQKSIPRKK